MNEEGLRPSLPCPHSRRPCPHHLPQGSWLFPEVRPWAGQRWVVAEAVLLSVLSAETARPGQSVCQLGACGEGQGGVGKLTSQGSQTFAGTQARLLPGLWSLAQLFSVPNSQAHSPERTPRDLHPRCTVWGGLCSLASYCWSQSALLAPSQPCPAGKLPECCM